jgi:hypothetical protein
MAVDRCVICGEIVPEGMQVCPACMKKSGASEKEIKAAKRLKDVANILRADSTIRSIQSAIDSIFNIAEELEGRE